MKTTRTLCFLGLIGLAPVSASANSLLDIYELALENDAQLQADEAAYEAGQENRTLGRAALLPQIDARAFYTEEEEDTQDNTIGADDPTEERNITTERENSGWEISLNQTLFDMSAWYNYQRGDTLSKLAEVQFGADQQALIVRVAEAYFNVLRAAENLQTAQAEEKALRQQLEQTEQRYDVGLNAITEVHEAQSVYDSSAAAVLEAQGNLGIAYEELEVLTGQPHDRIAPLSEDFPVVRPSPSDRHEWVEFALKNNYELKASRLNTRASEQTARASKSEHLPTLSASATYSDAENQGAQYLGGQIGSVQNDSEARGHSFSINLNIPLFSGGSVSAERRQAQAEYLQTRSEETRAERTVIQSARSLHLSVETGVSQVKARRQAIVSAESALEATRSGYEVGTRNLVEVLEAEQSLYQAELDYQNALYDYIINTFELREVAGMLTPADVQRIDAALAPEQMLRRSDFDLGY